MAWLEDDDDDDSDSDEDEDGNEDDSCYEDESGNEGRMDKDEDVVEFIDGKGGDGHDDMEELGWIKESRDLEPKATLPLPSGGNDPGPVVQSKRRISFCINNLYYSIDGEMSCEKGRPGNENDEEGRKYDQCPPLSRPDNTGEVPSGTEEQEDAETDEE